MSNANEIMENARAARHETAGSYQPPLNKLCVGDLVEPISAEHTLASGCGYYDHAVVVSTEPFVLVSPMADMKWGCTVVPEGFRTIGTAKPETLEKCMKRLHS